MLEYYAFEPGLNYNEERLASISKSLRKALQDFNYTQLDYDLMHSVSAQWMQFHARVSRVYNALTTR